ncbi:MAG: type IX secretion system sortase PorU, partial [Bacteroidales bacterium]|nr:type IX secretion system sortase PorU [Bacteroidales bacterium]
MSFFAGATLGQHASHSVAIEWKTIPDSVTATSVLFDNAGSCEEFPVKCYFKEFAAIGSSHVSPSCVGIIYDVHLDFVSKAENIFLEKTGPAIPDTLFYRFYTKTVGDSSKLGICVAPYVRTDNGFLRVSGFSFSYSSDTAIGINTSRTKSLSNSVLAGGEWFVIAVNNTGIHKITVGDFENSGVRVRGKSISDLAVFGNGGGPLPEKNNEPRLSDLAENAILVADENNDGIFNDNDYILFYAEAANVWRYNRSSGWFEYVVHPYATENYYFFTCSSGIGTTKRVAYTHISGATPTTTLNTYVHRSVINNDLVNTHNSGQIWVGERFSSTTPSRTFTLNAPYFVADSNIHTRYALASISSRASSFTVDWGNGRNTVNLHPLISNYSINNNDFSLSGGNSVTFSITYNCNDGLAAGYLDFIEINAISQLRFGQGQKDFRTFGTYAAGSVARYAIAASNSNIRVWDITTPTDIHNMVGNLSNDTFYFNAYNDSLREFLAFDGSSYYSPLRIAPVQNQNLHALSSVDLVIVSHNTFLEQAERIADLHRIYDGLSVAVVTPEQVYNEFSSGKQDAVAIRSLMKMLFDKSQTDASESAPRYLMIFGKASYDNRNLLQNNQNTVVTYESTASFDSDGLSYASDDFFGYLHDSESGLSRESLDIGIGRLPARTLSEAQTLADKIENYITRKDFEIPYVKGDWRNAVVFLADDADPGSPGDVDFLESSEYTTEIITEKFPTLNIEKIFADSYVQQSGAIGSFYPDVKNALTRSINNGCLLLNYVGHGSYDHIGSERYMERSDIDFFSNKYALPFFMASTCTFGKFDMTNELSWGEKFVLAPNGGGIATVAATRPISHSRSFDTKICSDALDYANGRQNAIGDALKNAKNNSISPHALILIGDPALKLSLPDKQVVVTKINGTAVCDSIADTATVLSEITVEGLIRNTDGSLDSTFNGIIYGTTFDRVATYYTLANDNEDTELPFTQQKSVLAKSTDTIIDGHFTYTFIV